MIAIPVVTAVARQEIASAYDWYEDEVPGLGTRFLDELDHQIERIAKTPHRFPVVYADVRRAKLNHFPYGLFFRQPQQTIYVIACFHSSRDPATWQNRV